MQAIQRPELTAGITLLSMLSASKKLPCVHFFAQANAIYVHIAYLAQYYNLHRNGCIP